LRKKDPTKMPSFEHKKLIEQIIGIDLPPTNGDQFKDWMLGEAQLNLMAENARSEEMIIFASGPQTFIHTVAVPNAVLSEANPTDLLSWSGDPFKSSAAYVWSGSKNDLSIEFDDSKPFFNSKTLKGVKDLIYGRTFEGWKAQNGIYFEVNQEYAHLAGIHYRPEHGSYCRFDENGDLAHSVSVTTSSDTSNVSLVTFQWDALEKYLAASSMSLVRLFDLTLVKKGAGFSGWGDGPEKTIEISSEFQFRQKAIEKACYTRGYQIIRVRAPESEIRKKIVDGWFGNTERKYAEFIGHDWRNDIVRTMSTAPSATTNYFDAKDNELPFELSPVFFRPEVLSKYKTDREKYTVGDREVTCRTAWRLRGVDINEAGQVHAYICDLRNLPYNEQLHWLSYNEVPKAKISHRAFVNDFEGDFVNYSHPRNQILSKLLSWKEKEAWFWTLRDDALLDQANPPLTSSKDEWADAFMDLSKLIVEGFNSAELRSILDREAVSYQKDEQSIGLVEKILSARKGTSVRLSGIRLAHRIRSKVKGHAGASEGQTIPAEAIANHGSYGAHFKSVCQSISDELTLIEDNIS
jgi:hypothetical protein